MVATSPWPGHCRLMAWASFGVYFVGFVLFFVAYTGHNWYVVPVENNSYPPDNPVAPLTLGLFYMCYRQHCMYDLRMDYYVVNLLPPKMEITYAYQHYRAVCMGIITIAMLGSLLTLAVYLLFLSGLSLSPIIGFIAAGIEILSGIIALIGVIIFGKTFRGASNSLPFGWSFGLMCAAFSIYIINGIVLCLIVPAIMSRLREMRSMSSKSQPLNYSM